MVATRRSFAPRALISALVAGALVCDFTPAGAAEIIGTPRNVQTADVQIVSCSVTIDPENANAFPAISLRAVNATGPKAVSAQVELDLHDALGGADDTRVLGVPLAKSDVPLASYPVDGNYVGLGCHIRTISFDNGTVQTLDYGRSAGGAVGGGTALAVLGGLAVVGGIAAAAGHGGGSNPAPAPTHTLVITPSATPSPTPSPTPHPTATPLPTATPTASPVPSPTASPTAGALVLKPQSLSFIAAGSSYAQTAQASETNYTGIFMASPATCAGGVASISPASAASGTFTVTPLVAGSCTFAITDAAGDQQTLTVNVTTTGGTIQKRGRQSAADAATPGPVPAPGSGGPPPRH